MEKNKGVGTLTSGFQTLADMYTTTMKSAMENTMQNVGTVNEVMNKMGFPTLSLPGKKTKSNCCPPEDVCPPHCLTQLSRNAFEGERIIVPFGVKNTCQQQKRYRVGVRELKHINGSIAPTQPILNKSEVVLERGETEMVLMMIELKGFEPGTYQAEIVLREKEINQNICFTLKVDNYDNLVVAEPLKEIEYRLHWQSWQRHFYCETPGRRTINSGNRQ